jgi:glucose/arabinose dehydrogenase
MSQRLFAVAEGATTRVSNATSATATVAAPYDCDGLVLTNSSTTATAFIRVTYYESAVDAAAAVSGNSGVAPTATTDLPILPASQIVRYVQKGKHKVFRTIASAADGYLYVSPGSAI